MKVIYYIFMKTELQKDNEDYKYHNNYNTNNSLFDIQEKYV